RANAEQYEEVRKMCDALRELFADELEKREERGIELGIERGIECGIEQGREQGILLNLVSLVRKKQKKGMAVEEIAEILEADLQLVQKMYHVLELHPEHTDTEIVELLKM
ncbi:MAG: 3-isopropylmalate dehydrogenase, partial [Hungatella hathewayi]